ncbi:MAG TPA: hypothetical protein PLM79_15800 [Syntrophobacteraceae bacterium]|nr:hypothetical protein [Syntrophobacteraceae bacterium]
MKIQAIFEDGILKPTRPLRLKHKLVTIEIPDEEVLDEEVFDGEVIDEELMDEQLGAEQIDVYKKYNLPPEAKAKADEMLARLAAIAEEVLSIPEDQLPELTEKQRERFEAFKLREDR